MSILLRVCKYDKTYECIKKGMSDVSVYIMNMIEKGTLTLFGHVKQLTEKGCQVK